MQYREAIQWCEENNAMVTFSMWIPAVEVRILNTDNPIRGSSFLAAVQMAMKLEENDDGLDRLHGQA